MKYPIGIQSFEKIRKDSYLYVDKTALVYKIVSEGSYYFLNRPRRFGKSLLISTLEAYFLGKKELFEGLALEHLETKWTKRPVLHLDLNNEQYNSEEALETILNRNLLEWENLYGKGEGEETVAGRFTGIIRRAHRQSGHRVAILVDEYDKPLLQAIDEPGLQESYRNKLKAFYSVLKTCDADIKFALLTGVTKFSKVSVFSDLNNLMDISMDYNYVEICGISEKELQSIFDDEVGEMAKVNGINKEECYTQLKNNYDGYHFEAGTVGLYNPFSLLNALSSKRMKSYWFETGTPSFLVERLKKTNFPLELLTEETVATDTLNSIDEIESNPLPLLYQSGYLTIKDYDREFDEYLLGFPNKEVEEGFIRYLSKYYVEASNPGSAFDIRKFVKEVRNGQPQEFMQRLEAMFADVDYHIVGDAELYFHNALYIVFKLLGFIVEVERELSDGRMDMVVTTPQYIYIFEFKINQSADAALQQIEDKQYAAPFKTDKRTIYKIGVNFSTKSRRIEEWKIKA